MKELTAVDDEEGDDDYGEVYDADEVQPEAKRDATSQVAAPRWSVDVLLTSDTHVSVNPKRVLTPLVIQNIWIELGRSWHLENYMSAYTMLWRGFY